MHPLRPPQLAPWRWVHMSAMLHPWVAFPWAFPKGPPLACPLLLGQVAGQGRAARCLCPLEVCPPWRHSVFAQSLRTPRPG